MRYFYSAVFYLLLPFIALRMLWRSRRAPAYRQRLSESLGRFHRSGLAGDRPVIWVHAVSVGETIAAAPLVEALLARYPDHSLVITTTTPTGSERVRALFGERVFHVYAPWDVPGATRRFFNAIQPRLLLLMETELWPNMLHRAQASGCPVVLANARLSERSARGYGRVASLTRDMLGQLAAVGCQAPADGERFVALGLPPERLRVTGTIKFDITLAPELVEQAAALDALWHGDHRTIVVAASTHPGEDEQILAAYTALKDTVGRALLVLVPRHPERFDAVYATCCRAGWTVRRRSRGDAVDDSVDILLGDTMGELLLLLGVADIALIGGSLVEHGGHNVLEPAVWGVPVVTGPHMFNFADISRLLVDAGAMVQLQDPALLPETLIALSLDPQRRASMGAAGRQVVADNRGAGDRLLALVESVYPPPP